MDDLLREFLTETTESLSVLDSELVKLEQNPNDPGLLANIFRLVHTIKGTCGFLGLPRLEAVAHASENVLGKVRDGEMVVTPTTVSLILKALDRIKLLVGQLEASESEPAGEDSDLTSKLNALAEGRADEIVLDEPAEAAAVEAAPAPVEAPKPAPAAPAPAAPAPAAPAKAAAKGGKTQSLYERFGGESMVDATIDSAFQAVANDAALKALIDGIDLDLLQGYWRDNMVKALGSINRYKPADMTKLFAPAVAKGFGQAQFKTLHGYIEASLKMLEVQPDVLAEILPMFAGVRDDMLAGDKPAAKAVVAAKGEGVPAVAEQAKESAVAGQSIRVHVDVLENLMTMVSELVLTRNQLLQILRSQQESEFAAPLQRLSQVTSELQEGVMKTRMQPIGNAWAKLPRIVRDLSVELHKKIDLQMHGAETELDRQVLELIRDPLTHMVRNSGDHGIEMPADRLAAGKPETGTINLNAYHEGGHIIIEIADDGRGLNVGRIKAKAISSGLATESELDAMPEQQIYQFIFKAGFSTAAQVTAVSGRGVGMDVVRTNIEKIGGTVELRSREGKGTTFVIKIPLTLAIVSALIVECAGERFAIPQMSVLELVRTSSTSEHIIENINGAPVMRLRDRLLSLVSLRDLLKLTTAEGKEKKDENYIVVAQVGTFTFGIMVDRVFDTEEIVVKPVAPILRHIQMFSGNTILGDGSVIMILDPNGIATAASGERASGDGVADAAAAGDRGLGEGEKVAILTFRAGEGGPKAVPLALIARLEEFEVEKVEVVGDRRVMQYRGKLMPLIPIDPSYQPIQSGRQPVLVFSDGDRSMGLLVDEIIDVVEERLQIELSASRPGIIGTAVISAKSTELVDAGHYLTLAFGDWFSRGTMAEVKKRQKRLLLVEDSSFFRHMITPVLSVAGYEVTAVDTAKKALDLCERGLDVDVIVSDIEMPEMNGYEFVSAVRGTARWGNLPVLALSSNTAPEHIERGRAAGFDDYVAKSDRDALLASLEQTLANEGDLA